MAEVSDGTADFRSEWYQSLVKVKTTAEGLLAIQSVNVWSTYGGLERLCSNVEDILMHGLKASQSQFGNALDYWPFVRGLRWLKPTMAPSIEQINRLVAMSPGLTHGQLWLRQSLTNHNLSLQLEVLISSPHHLSQFYEEDAFLCQRDYVQALIICLQAIEQNKATLLTDINPTLIRPSQSRDQSGLVRSASLPINAPDKDEMFRRVSLIDPLAPPFASPKSESILNLSDEHAKPHSIASSPESLPSAKDALLQVLEKSGGVIDPSPVDEVKPFLPHVDSDPLMNMQIIPSATFPLLHSKKLTAKHLQSSSNGKSKSAIKSHDIPYTHPRQSSELLDKILNEEPDLVDKSQEGADSLSRNSGSLPDVTRVGFNDGVLNPGQQLSERVDSGVSLNDETTQVCQARSKKTSHQRSMSDIGVQRSRPPMDYPPVQNFVKSTKTGQRSGSDSLSCSVPSRPRNASLLSEGGSGSIVTPASECFFPRPVEGQSLVSFLSSQDFRTCAELDRENAHFSISEALIAAIEQMKCNHVLHPAQDSEQDGDSDEEIQQLKQRIRIRRTERLKEKASGFPPYGAENPDDMSGVAGSSPIGSLDDCTSESEAETSDDVDDQEINDVDADLAKQKLQEVNTEERTHLENSTVVSAEAVAISLLKKFSEHQLPKASDLQWLVSEQDAPQALLPLPNSYPVSPDDNENADLFRGKKSTRIRGNLEWAPPRAQIIFNTHPQPKRKVILARQNHRCAGCGSKVEPEFQKRYRYCEYLGKYFCPCCHSNEMQYIPAHILKKWDFRKFYISHFSRDLLNRMYNDPLFNVIDINPGLYRKSRGLDTVREYRMQLVHLKPFLKACRLAESLYQEMEGCPGHWVSDIHTYSLGELVQIKQGTMQQKVKLIVSEAVSHISQCLLCQARGFICEICNNDSDLLYPFELHRVTQCPACRSCFHGSCFVPDRCPKCARIEARKTTLSRTLSTEDEDDLGLR